MITVRLQNLSGINKAKYMKEVIESINMVLEGQSSLRDIQNYVESWVRNTRVHGSRPNLDTETVLKVIVKSMIRGMKDNFMYDTAYKSEIDEMISDLEKTDLSK